MIVAQCLPHVGHVDSEMSWRGGQQQLCYLAGGLIKKGYPVTLFVKEGSEIENRLKKTGIRRVSVPMKGELDFLSGRRIADDSRKAGIDLLHLHSAHALSIGLWAKLFYPRIRLVASRRVDFHIKGGIFGKLKYANSYIERIICISGRIRQVLLGDGIPEKKLTLIHSGIDIHRYRDTVLPEGFKSGLGIPDHHLVIGTVAAMAWHKDYPTLLKAARMVLDKADRVTFCAVGDGPDEPKIKALANSLGLGGRFVFTGFRADLGNFFKLFDIFVLSSRLEGLGTSILDAQAVGLPVVASNTGGIPEAVRHDENGLLFPAENPRALADALIEAIKNKELRRRLGERARQTVTAFDIHRTIDQHMQLYKEILNC